MSHRKTTTSYLVPVGDLLHKQWSSDSFTLHDFCVEKYTLTDWIIKMTSISDTEIIVHVWSFSYSFEMTCDYCGENIKDNEYTTKAELVRYILNLNSLPLDEQESNEMTFEIQQDRTIDLFPALRAIVLLSDQSQHICSSCIERISEVDTKNSPQQTPSSTINTPLFTYKQISWK